MLKVMKNDQIFSIFSCFRLVPQVFGQVNNWFLLEFHEMIRVVHVVACPIVFILFYGWRCWEGVFKTMKSNYFFDIFSRLDPFPKFLNRLKVVYFITSQNNKNVTFSFVPKWFYLILWARLAGRSVQIMKNDYFSVFSRLGPFSQVFGQVKEWLMLELHKIIRVSYVVTWPFFFFFILWMGFPGRSVHSYEKWSFSVFMAAWILFRKFLGRWGSSLS